jgi:hypothetical protein
MNGFAPLDLPLRPSRRLQQYLLLIYAGVGLWLGLALPLAYWPILAAWPILGWLEFHRLGLGRQALPWQALRVDAKGGLWLLRAGEESAIPCRVLPHSNLSAWWLLLVLQMPSGRPKRLLIVADMLPQPADFRRLAVAVRWGQASSEESADIP